MLEGLEKISSRYKVRIHSYCLMPNHFHLLIEQQDLSVSLAMRSLATSYARYFNNKYHKVGHVFQGRFRGILCDKRSYLLELVRYIHLNPVRARLVQWPQEWEWSSFAAYLGKSKNEWLFQKDVMEIFGRQPRHRLQEFLAQAPDLRPEQIYPLPSLPMLGNKDFISRVSEEGEPRRRRRRAYTRQKMSLSELAELLAGAEGMTLAEFRRSHKGARQQTEVRERFVHVATRSMFYPAIEVARFLGVHPSAATRMNRRYDAKIQNHPQLEDRLMGLLMQDGKQVEIVK